MIRITNQNDDALICLDQFFGVTKYLKYVMEQLGQNVGNSEKDQEVFVAFKDTVSDLYDDAIDFVCPVNMHKITDADIKNLFASVHIMELIDNKNKVSHTHSAQLPLFAVMADLEQGHIVSISPPAPIIPILEYNANSIGENEVIYNKPIVRNKSNGIYEVTKDIQKGLIIFYIKTENYSTSDLTGEEPKSEVKSKFLNLLTKKEITVNNSKVYGTLYYGFWDHTKSAVKQTIIAPEDVVKYYKDPDNFKMNIASNPEWAIIQKEWNRIATTGEGEFSFKITGIKKDKEDKNESVKDDKKN
jgi:hypothetical protein